MLTAVVFVQIDILVTSGVERFDVAATQWVVVAREGEGGRSSTLRLIRVIASEAKQSTSRPNERMD